MTLRKPKPGLVFSEAVSSFCCGLREVGSFEVSEGYYLLGSDMDYYNEKEVREAFKVLKKEDSLSRNLKFKDNVRVIDGEDNSEDLSDNKGLFATTAAKSQEDVEVLLKKLKFKKVSSFVNPGTKNKVNVWFRKPKGQR